MVGQLQVTSAGIANLGNPATQQTQTIQVVATNTVGDSAPANVIINYGPINLAHGQLVTAANVGRAGAQANNIQGFSTATPTANGAATTISTSQTVSLTNFTNTVTVTAGTVTFNNCVFGNFVRVQGGTVTFNFCRFTYQPPSASGSSLCGALFHYNNGSPMGVVNINWSEFDTGLRGNVGNFETAGYLVGVRSVSAGQTNSGSFNMYRSSFQGYGNGLSVIGLHTPVMNFITECYIDNLTSGGAGGPGNTHMDGLEYYTSDNLTMQRCRVHCDTSPQAGQSCVQPANQDFGNTNDAPIIFDKNYFNGGIGAISVFYGGPAGSGTRVRNLKFTTNYFGDDTQYGAELDLGGDGVTNMNICYDLAYWNANQAGNTPGMVYFALDNVWAPNGEGVLDPAQGFDPAGQSPTIARPHIPGQFFGTASAFGGNVFTYNGAILGPNLPPVVASNPVTLTLPLTVGQTVAQYTGTNTPLAWRLAGVTSPANDIAVLKYVVIDQTGKVTVTQAGVNNLTPATYQIRVQAINGSGPGTTTENITVNAQAAAPVITNTGVHFPLSTSGMTAGQVVGQMTASNNPTSWAITGVTPANAITWFDFDPTLGTGGSDNIRITSAGASAITPQTYNISVRASNTVGNGTGSAFVDATAPAVPVISGNGPFTVQPNPGLDIFVGNMTATNQPVTSWAIINGDPNKNFAIYLQGTGSQFPVGSGTLRTSDGTAAGGGGGPAPPPGNYPLTIRATNAAGNSAPTNCSVTVQANTSPPIINPTGGLTVTLKSPGNIGVTVGTVVTTMTASGATPITWSFVGGNTQGWWAIDTNTGQVTVTTAGASTSTGITAGTWGPIARATNSFGTNDLTLSIVAQVQSGFNDGLANAPPGAAPFPNALLISPQVAQPQNKTYVTRPPWNVPGVNYNVGPQATPTKDPATLVNGSTITTSGTNMRFSGSSPIVVDGYDFRLSGAGNKGGWTIDVSAVTMTFRNCIFGWNFGGSSGSQVSWDNPAVSLTFQYCIFDHRSWLSHNPADPQGNGGVWLSCNGGTQPQPQNLTVQYCWHRGTPNHTFHSTCPPDVGAAMHVDWRFNLLSEHGQGAAYNGSHFNMVQWGGLPNNTTCIYQFNFFFYYPINADNETLQFYPNGPAGQVNGATCTADVGWNVWVGANTNPSAVGLPDPNGNPSTPIDQSTWTCLNYPVNANGGGIVRAMQTTIHNNYLDKSGYTDNDIGRGGPDQFLQNNNIYLITGGTIPR